MRMQELTLLLLTVTVMAQRLEAGHKDVSHSDSLPQANSSSLQGDRVRRNVVCPKSEYRPSGKEYCCNECPAGFYKRSDCQGHNLRTECAQCQEGTFTAFSNHVSRCRACQQCDSVLGQVQLEPCTLTRNTACGCPTGMFQIRIDSKTFYCRNCTLCRNGVYRECSGYNDTICHCDVGHYFHLKSKKCQLCESCDREHDSCDVCRGVMFPADNTPQALMKLTVFAFSALGVLTLGAFGYMVWKVVKRRRAASLSPGKTEESGALQAPFANKVTLLPIQEVSQSSDSPCYAGRAPDLPDCVQIAGSTELPNNIEVNYAIADLVPASRWREFVRRLGMHDRDIERCELDSRHGFREAQYAMLRAWRQQRGARGATTEAICRVLKDMDLNSCVEQLQEALH